MTQREFTHILNSLDSLSPEQNRQLRYALDGKASTTTLPTNADEAEMDSGAKANLGSIGAMRDSAEELDEIVADIYRKRREETWRELDL